MAANVNSSEFEGYHKGNIEVFWCHPDSDAVKDGNMPAGGWYWWSCCPGCLPDGEPSGPFDTSKEAYDDAFDGFYDATEGDEDGAAV